MSPVYPASSVRVVFRGVEITGDAHIHVARQPSTPYRDFNASITVTLRQLPSLNPIGPNGSRRRGRNASNRYFAALLVRQGGKP